MKSRLVLLIGILVLLFSPINAYAYIDPGVGSALIQGILGIIVAVSVVLKLYWYRILKFLGVKKESPENQKNKD